MFPPLAPADAPLGAPSWRWKLLKQHKRIVIFSDRCCGSDGGCTLSPVAVTCLRLTICHSLMPAFSGGMALLPHWAPTDFENFTKCSRWKKCSLSCLLNIQKSRCRDGSGCSFVDELHVQKSWLRWFSLQESQQWCMNNPCGSLWFSNFTGSKLTTCIWLKLLNYKVA